MRMHYSCPAEKWYLRQSWLNVTMEQGSDLYIRYCCVLAIE